MKSFGWLVALASVLATACDQSPVAPTTVAGTAPAAITARTSDIVHIPFFVQDAGGQAPSAPSTPLFEARKRNPVLGPTGRQLTLAEFAAVEGTVSVQCVAGGTQVTLQLRNLIPNGVYTIWNVVFKAPGFDPSFANLTGLGALGSGAGTQNVFKASATGDGALTATTVAGPLSMQGSIGGCALTDEFEWHVVGAYHIDGQSHGPSLGPDGSAVEQFGFIFKR
jgi:hypothetical protein